MGIILPDKPVPAMLDLLGNNFLIEGDYGIGKSGLLASTGYLLADPEDKLRSYPDTYRVTLPNWKAHLEFRDAVAKAPKDRYPGIGLDSLNISYTHCLQWVMENVKFAGSYLKHPSENPQIGYPRVTYEFISWVRDVTLLGYHVIATCHVTVVEIRDKKGSMYNRWVPSFVGGSAESSYQQILKIFPVIGFMTLEEVERPPTRSVMGKQVADVRADASRIYDQKRVIHFDQSPNWLANNKHGGFPDVVVLTDDYREDWQVLQDAWGSEGAHEEAPEPVKLAPSTGAPAGARPAGLGK